MLGVKKIVFLCFIYLVSETCCLTNIFNNLGNTPPPVESGQNINKPMEQLSSSLKPPISAPLPTAPIGTPVGSAPSGVPNHPAKPPTPPSGPGPAGRPGPGGVPGLAGRPGTGGGPSPTGGPSSASGPSPAGGPSSASGPSPAGGPSSASGPSPAGGPMGPPPPAMGPPPPAMGPSSNAPNRPNLQPKPPSIDGGTVNQRLPEGPTTQNLPTYCRCITKDSECDGFIVKDLNPKKLDLRIVNNDTIPRPCPMGQKNCCTDKQFPTKCGMRKILSLEAAPINQARYGSYPWHAEILSVNNEYIGAGVIINEFYILTVAHKVANLSNMYKVRLGKWNRTNNMEQSFEVTPFSTKIHEAYDPATLVNDIALIKMKQKIIFSDFYNINAVCLPSKIFPPNAKFLTAGWGKTNFTTSKLENVLKEVDLEAINHKDCEAKLQKTRLLNDFRLDGNSFICAGGKTGKDACTGDGGGALVHEQETGQFEVVGLTSWGIGCGDSDVPGVYVNVYNYIKWIEANMEPKKLLKLDPRSY